MNILVVLFVKALRMHKIITKQMIEKWSSKCYDIEFICIILALMIPIFLFFVIGL